MKRRKNIRMFSNEANIKRAAIYCRVSTIMQGEAEYSSLNAQEDQLRGHCKGKGWEVVKVYKDIKSGKDLERDEIQQLLKDAEEKLFDIVVATKIDRFSRSIVDFYEFSEKLNSLDVALASATQPIDTSSSAGLLMLDIFLAFAQFERNIISERTKEGMNARAQKGFYTGGHLILGYDNVEGKLIVNETEKELVSRIFNYYIAEPSTRTVSQRLNREGFQTKTQVTKKGFNKGGKAFTKEAVLRTLRNKTYLGLLPWKDKVYPGIHEAIIDETLFNEVQTKLGESKINTQVTRKLKTHLTLLGITKCGICGSSLTSSSSKSGKHYYYKCSKKMHATSDHCPAKDLSSILLEDAAKSLMYSMATNEGFFEAIYNQIRFNNQTEIKKYDGELNKLRSNKTRLVTDKQNILNKMKAAAALQDSKLIIDELNKLENDIAMNLTSINFLEKERERAANQVITREQLKKIIKDYLIIYEELSHEDKVRFNKLIFVEIISYFDKNSDDGDIEFRLRGDGQITKKWSEIKNANLLTGQIRTSGGFGSANLNHLEPFFLAIKSYIPINTVLKCWLKFNFQPIHCS